MTFRPLVTYTLVCLTSLVQAGVQAGLAHDKPALLARARTLLAEGKEAAAEQEFGALAALARQTHDLPLEAEAIGEIGYLQYNRGAMADALTNLQTAYRFCAQLGDQKGRLDALANIANVYADTHVAQYDRAIEYYRQLLDEYEKHGQPSDVADTVFNIGSTLEMKGDFAAAELQRQLGPLDKALGEQHFVGSHHAVCEAVVKGWAAAGATLKVLLAHNQVVWTLEGPATKRVDASVAWKAPRGSGAAWAWASLGRSSRSASSRCSRRRRGTDTS